MINYLMRLAARSLGMLDVISPRTLSLFEPIPQNSSSFEEDLPMNEAFSGLIMDDNGQDSEVQRELVSKNEDSDSFSARIAQSRSDPARDYSFPSATNAPLHQAVLPHTGFQTSVSKFALPMHSLQRRHRLASSASKMPPGNILSPIVPSIVRREPKIEFNVRPVRNRKDQSGKRSPSSPTIIPCISPFWVRATSGSNGIEDKEMSSHKVHENDSKKMIASRETEMLSHQDEGRSVSTGHHGVDHERMVPGEQMAKSSNQAEGPQSEYGSSPKMHDLAAIDPMQLVSDPISQLAFPGATDYEDVELQKTASSPQFIPDTNTKISPGNDYAGKSDGKAKKPPHTKALEVLFEGMPLHSGRDKAAIPLSYIGPLTLRPIPLVDGPHDDLSSIGPVPDEALIGATDSASPPVPVHVGTGDASPPANASSTGMSTAPTGSMAEVNVEKNNAGMRKDSSVGGVNSPSVGNISGICSSYTARESSEERGDGIAGTVEHSIVAYDSEPNGQPTQLTPSLVIEDLSGGIALQSGRDKATIPSSDISSLTFGPIPLDDDPHDYLFSIGPVPDEAQRGATEDAASPPVPVHAGPNDVNQIASSLSSGLRKASTGSVAEADIEKNSAIMLEEISFGMVNSPFSAPLPSSQSREQVLSAFDIDETIDVLHKDAKKGAGNHKIASSQTKSPFRSAFSLRPMVENGREPGRMIPGKDLGIVGGIDDSLVRGERKDLSGPAKLGRSNGQFRSSLSRQMKPSRFNSNIINPEPCDKQTFSQIIPNIGPKKIMSMSEAINNALNEDKIGNGQKPDDQSKKVLLEVAAQNLPHDRDELMIESAQEDGRKPDASLSKGGFKTIISSPKKTGEKRQKNFEMEIFGSIDPEYTLGGRRRVSNVSHDELSHNRSMNADPEHLVLENAILEKRMKADNSALADLPGKILAIEPRTDRISGLKTEKTERIEKTPEHLEISEISESLKKRNESGTSIRVTIGRIDVRADFPLSLQEKQKRATPASYSALRLSLDDYLKQRNEGNI